MSLRITTLVWDSPAVGHNELAVLLVLADCADDDGRCWPSVETIARRARMSQRRARQVLAGLRGRGLVRSVRRGQHATNMWVIDLDALAGTGPAVAGPDLKPTSADLKPVAGLGRGPDLKPTSPDLKPTSARPEAGFSQNHQEPSKNQEQKHSAAEAAESARGREVATRSTSDPPGFTEFWHAYPRKVAKAAAAKAYAKALQRADAGQILNGLATALPGLQATEPRYRPHPATWLNGDRWNDPPPDTTSSSNGNGTWTSNYLHAQQLTDQLDQTGTDPWA